MKKNIVRLTESQLHQVIKESVQKILTEHEEDWFDESDTAYIGRTNAYYDEDEDSMFQDDLWTYSTTPTDKDFAGEVYELSEEGKSELNWWIRCQRFNGYQRSHAFNPNTMNSEEMWENLVQNYGTLIKE